MQWLDELTKLGNQIQLAKDQRTSALNVIEDMRNALSGHIEFIRNILPSLYQHIFRTERSSSSFDTDRLSNYQYLITDFGDQNSPEVQAYVRECARQNNELENQLRSIQLRYEVSIQTIRNNATRLLNASKPRRTFSPNEIQVGYLLFTLNVHPMLTDQIRRCFGELYDNGHVKQPLSIRVGSRSTLLIEHSTRTERMTMGGIQRYIAGMLLQCRETVGLIEYLDLTGDRYALGPLVSMSVKGYLKAYYDEDSIRQRIDHYAQISPKQYSVVVLRGDTTRLMPLRSAISEISRNIVNNALLQLIIVENVTNLYTDSLVQALPGVILVKSDENGQSLNGAEIEWLPLIRELPYGLLVLPEKKAIEAPPDNRYIQRFPLTNPGMQRRQGHQPLKVPVAVGDDGQIIEFDLPIATYIGGQPRAGKSTLLNTMITGLISRYHPDDVEIWLIDFGGGRSFYWSLNTKPVHVRYIAVGNPKTPDLALSVIDRLSETLVNRQRRFERIFNSNPSLRNLPHEIENLPPDVIEPRIVVFIDEFKVLNNSLTNLTCRSSEYKKKINDVFTNGMAYGFSMVIASQTWSDLSVLEPSKEQFFNRISLKQTQVSSIREVVNVPELDQHDLDMINHLQAHYILYRAVINGRNRLKRGHVLFFNKEEDERKREEYILQMNKALDGRYKTKRSMFINIQEYPALTDVEAKTFRLFLEAVSKEKLYVKPGKTYGLTKMGDAGIALSLDECENILIVGASFFHRQVASMLKTICITAAMQLNSIALLHAKSAEALLKDLATLYSLKDFGFSLDKLYSVFRTAKDKIKRGENIDQLWLMPELSAFLRLLSDNTNIGQRTAANPFAIADTVESVTKSVGSSEGLTNRHDFQQILRELLTGGPKYGLHIVCTFRSIRDIEACLGIGWQELFHHKIVFVEANTIRDAREMGISSDEKELLSYMSDGVVRYIGNNMGITFQPYEYDKLPFIENGTTDDLE